VQKAVSNTPGIAQPSLQRDPEANSIVHGEAVSGETETVSVITLDECMDRYLWTDIELIKMDAEGEENDIVNGAVAFLQTYRRWFNMN
jgi:FkbM family methyltransferase